MLNDFKDENGHLTRWGKVNLSGLVFASLVGVVIQVYDTQEQNKKDLEQSEKDKAAQEATQKLLQQAVDTNGNVNTVLGTSKDVLKGVADSLNKQSALLA